MQKRTIVEFERINSNSNATAPEIVRSTDRPDCSDEKSQNVGCRNKRHHRGKSKSKDALVLDFALSHHTAEFCKSERFSLKQVQAIMKECLTIAGRHATLNISSVKQLKKIIFDCIPYSAWYSLSSFPTLLKEHFVVQTDTLRLF